MCACVRVVCARACVRACVHLHVCTRVCIHMHVYTVHTGGMNACVHGGTVEALHYYGIQKPGMSLYRWRMIRMGARPPPVQVIDSVTH